MVFISQNHKQCSKCNETKPIDDFHKSKSNKDGLNIYCKICKSSLDKQYRELNQDKIKQGKKKYYNENKESIAITKKEYQQKNKESTKQYQKEYREKNKESLQQKQKEHRTLNQTKIKQSKKKYYEENKEKIKQYRIENKEAIKESKRQYRQTNKDALKHQTKTRMKTDNVFSLTRRIRKSINQSFANNGYTKKSRSYEILGCSFEEFKVYIENQFLAGMHWDNRSEWHLDHIVPVSFSESEDEIIMLNHYTNFRPLWAFDNISKHAKLTEEALEHPIYKRIIEQRSNNPN